MKLCVIYNTAPRYREAIFRTIDKEFDCDWYFGHTKNDIKEMDVSFLKNVKYYKTFGNPQKWYFKWGTIRLLFKKKYQTFFLIPSTRSITDWLFFWIAFAFFPKKKIFLWTHGWYGKEMAREAKMKLWLYRHATGTFTYGEYAKGLLIKEGIPEDKLFVIYNSLAYDQQLEQREAIKPSHLFQKHFDNNYPVIIVIGRLNVRKKLPMLIDAVSSLKKKGENYNIVFIGDGDDRDFLVKQVEKNGISDIVWFYGACYDEVKNAELLINADLCVVPGDIGLTAIHSMMFGVPVITHDKFSCQGPEFEIIKEGVTGLFFEHDNQSSLESSISKWFTMCAINRNEVRDACYKEIDTKWNPYYQMNVIKKHIIM